MGTPYPASDDTIRGMSEAAASHAPGSTRRATLLVYSSDAEVRDQVRLALGTRPSPDLEVEIVEASTGEEVVRRCDRGGIDLAILDGEAAPTGGIGLGRQLKDELDDAPPVLLLLGRRDDAWLATWSRAEGVVMHPIDAMKVTDAVLSLLEPDTAPARSH
jgi:DNA-binding NarL/FixJ family response regulator